MCFCEQMSYLEAILDVDGDRSITAEEILAVFKQVARFALLVSSSLLARNNN
jgi:hypothetical protein